MEAIQAIERFTPRFVTTYTLYYYLDAIDELVTDSGSADGGATLCTVAVRAAA